MSEIALSHKHWQFHGSFTDDNNVTLAKMKKAGMELAVMDYVPQASFKS